MNPDEVMQVIETALSADERVNVCLRPSALGLRAGANTLLVVPVEGEKFKLQMKFTGGDDEEKK